MSTEQQITMKSMLDAGVHFGHQQHRWNPKMKQYVFGVRGGIHIIDLQKSLIAAKRALEFVFKTGQNGGRVIFVGTKQQAIEPIQEAAKKCGQFYITKRWLGGTLTNFVTIKSSIDRYKKLEKMKDTGEWALFSKKEQSMMDKELARHIDYLQGIKDMRGAPAAIFVVDLVKERNAVAEAKRLGVPVIGIADTNCDPDIVDFAIPGNDDAIRSIKLFANAVAETYNEGYKDFKAKGQADEEEQKTEAKAPKKSAPKKDEKKGPAVIRTTKPRLVAAGMAEEVEIKEELEKQTDEPTTEQ
ncbi:MAG: 30S ribosomal protein S2 [Bdellovibrionales bacterium]